MAGTGESPIIGAYAMLPMPGAGVGVKGMLGVGKVVTEGPAIVVEATVAVGKPGVVVVVVVVVGAVTVATVPVVTPDGGGGGGLWGDVTVSLLLFGSSSRSL